MEINDKETTAWQETSGMTAADVAALQQRVALASLIEDAKLNPVHESVEPALDPDDAIRETPHAEHVETRGVPVDVDEYAPGTFFYYGSKQVAVGARCADGKIRIVRIEERKAS